MQNETRNPADESPQQRYARLHRAIENGAPNDGLDRLPFGELQEDDVAHR